MLHTPFLPSPTAHNSDPVPDVELRGGALFVLSWLPDIDRGKRCCCDDDDEDGPEFVPLHFGLVVVLVLVG